MKLRKIGIISVGFSIISFLVLMAGISIVNIGCGNNSPTSGANPTPVPNASVHLVWSGIVSGYTLYLSAVGAGAGTDYFQTTSTGQSVTFTGVAWASLPVGTYNVSMGNSCPTCSPVFTATMNFLSGPNTIVVSAWTVTSYPH